MDILNNNNEITPILSIKWFYATDIPKRNLAVYKKDAKNKSQPQKWKKFSKKCSARIEEAYQKLQQWERNHQQGMTSLMMGFAKEEEPPHLVSVNEDQLYDVDVKTKELKPVYWPGEVFEVRRGTWFHYEDGEKYAPCDESLSQQLEIGYRKFQPWVAGNSVEGTATPKSASVPETKSASKNDLSGAAASAEEKRWALLGPYINSYVVYAGQTQAWMLSDMLTSKISRVLLSKWSNGENLGGKRLVRGWQEVCALKKSTKKLPAASPATQPNATKQPGKETETAHKDVVVEATDDVLSSGEDNEDEAERPIEHLILVIHGIGQRWGTRMDSIGLVHDVRNMRSSLKACADQFFPVNPVKPSDDPKPDTELPTAAAGQTPFAHKKFYVNEVKNLVPRKGGVQVLPIQWRHRLGFDARMQTRENSAQGNSASDDETSAPEKSSPALSSSQIFNPEDQAQIQAKLPKVAQTGSRKRDRKYPIVPSLEDRATLGDVTLEGVPMIRNVISDVALDILLYMTPEHRQSMIVAVTSELNRVYDKFRKRNPSFTGKVSLYAHSLGSLIAFDILCNQTTAIKSADLEAMFRHIMVPLEHFLPDDTGARAQAVEQSVDLVDKRDPQNDPLEWVQSFGLKSTIFGRHSKSISAPGVAPGSGTNAGSLHYGKLNFDVDIFFTVGSPLGLFLVLENKLLRSYKTGHEDNLELDKKLGIVRPNCQAMYNIFHPVDPIAYRIEPHVHCELGRTKPVTISYTKPGFTNAMLTIQDFSSDLSSKGRSMLESVFGSFAFSAASVAGMMGSWGGASASVNASSGVEATEDGAESDHDVAEAASGVAQASEARDSSKALSSSSASKKTNGKKGAKHKDSAYNEGRREIRLLNPRGRLDYSIQEGLLENALLSSLGSHMSYWKDPDVNVFILRELFLVKRSV